MKKEQDVLVDEKHGEGEEYGKVELNYNKFNEYNQEEQDQITEDQDNVLSEQTLDLCRSQTLRAAMSQKSGGS